MTAPAFKCARGCIAAVACIALAACGATAYRGASAEGPPERISRSAAETGQREFVSGEMGALSLRTLETNAIPWKVATSALFLQANGGRARPITDGEAAGLYRRFGLMTPTRVVNWLGPQPPDSAAPLGLVRGYVDMGLPDLRLEVANFSCAACHAGPTFGPDGTPRQEAWLGGTNSSVDFDLLARTLRDALAEALSDRRAFLRDIRTIFPGIERRELRSIEAFVLPRLEARLERIGRWPTDDPLLYPAGGPGLTNAVGALKSRLGLLDRRNAAAERAFTQPPDISNAVLRSALVTDGSQAAPGRQRLRDMTRGDVTAEHLDGLAGVVSTFLMGTMGLDPSAAARARPRVRKVVDALAALEPQPFPGRIDRGKARRGAAVYAAACARCHGTYSPGIDEVRLTRFPNRLVPLAEIGTDATRARAVNGDVLRAMRESPVGRLVSLRITSGHVAPRLDGLWASAPYLHNGSVPTLWHLMHPSRRPDRFEVGGHALDFARVGIAGALDAGGTYRFRPGYRPWSTPAIYDATTPGRSNRGHAREFEALSEAARDALLEYLKLL